VMNLPGPGAIAVRSPLQAPGNIATFEAAVEEPERKLDFSCIGDYAREQFTIRLPPDLKVLAIPRDVEFTLGYQSYKASYHRDGNTVTVDRQITDVTPGPVCGPAVGAQYKSFATRVRKDLRAQILYE